MSFDTDGFEELSDDLEAFADDLAEARETLPDAIDFGVSESASDLKERMRDEAPSDSGTLRDSITSDKEKSARSGEARWSVGPTVDYAAHVEYGTGERGDSEHASGESYYITNEETSMSEIRKEMINARGDEGLDGLEDIPAIEIDGQYYLYAHHEGIEPDGFWRKSIAQHEAERNLIKNLDEQTSAVFKAVMK